MKGTAAVSGTSLAAGQSFTAPRDLVLIGLNQYSDVGVDGVLRWGGTQGVIFSSVPGGGGAAQVSSGYIPLNIRIPAGATLTASSGSAQLWFQ